MFNFLFDRFNHHPKFPFINQDKQVPKIVLTIFHPFQRNNWNYISLLLRATCMMIVEFKRPKPSFQFLLIYPIKFNAQRTFISACIGKIKFLKTLMSLITLLKMQNKNSNHKFDIDVFGQMTQEKSTRGKPVDRVFLISFQFLRKDTQSIKCPSNKDKLISTVEPTKSLENYA